MKITLQKNISDCSLHITKAIYEDYYHERISIERLRSMSNISNDGLSAASLVKLGNEVGISFEAFTAPIDEVLANFTSWCVFVVSNDSLFHYVLGRKHKKGIEILDSSKGRYVLSIDRFKMVYQNVFLSIARNGLIPKNKWKYSMKHLFAKSPIMLLAVSSFFLSMVLTIMISFFAKAVLDSVIPDQNKNLLISLTVVFSCLILVRSTNSFVGNYFLKKIQTSIEIDYTLTYYQKLKNAYLKDVFKISKSDHMRRISLMGSTASFEASMLNIVINKSLLLISSFIVMLVVSPLLVLPAILTIAIVALISLINKQMISKKYPDVLEKSKRLASSSFSVIDSLSDIKALGSHLLNKTRHDYKKYKEKDMEIWALAQVNSFTESLGDFLAPVIIMCIGSFKVMDNELTIGSLLFFITALKHFSSSVSSGCDFLLNLRMNLDNRKLITDFLLYDEEKMNAEGLTCTIRNISFKNVMIGFTDDILKVNNFEIKNSIHIKGHNGIGKSTFLKTVSFNIIPSQGLEINDVPWEFYSLQSIRDRVFYAPANPSIFAGTVMENITLNSYKRKNIFTLSWAWVREILLKSNLSLEMNLDHQGGNLSSGQRQIIGVLRALCDEYDIISLDEALENVDNEIVAIFRQAFKNSQAYFLEVSRSGKYIKKSKEVNIEKFKED